MKFFYIYKLSLCYGIIAYMNLDVFVDFNIGYSWNWRRAKHYIDIKYFYDKLFLKCWLILDWQVQY